jgi:hypothetical protein
VNVDKYNFIELTREEINKIAQENEKEAKEKGKFKFGVYY